MSDKLNGETANEPRGDRPTARQPYLRPVVVPLGSLRDLTLSTAQSGKTDGATSGRNRRTGRGGTFDQAGCAR